MNDFSGSTDAIIIGSGIGGLTAAIILAKLGYGVTIVEKNRQPGGLMRSYTRNGIECPVGVHYIGSMDKGQPLQRIFDYLDISTGLALERMGAKGIIDHYIFDDFTFDLPEGIESYEENLRSKFYSDQEQISSIINTLKNVASVFYSLDFLSSSRINPANLDLFQPMGKIVSQLNCSPGLRSVLEVTSAWIGVPLNECPVFYHNTTLASYLFSSWRLNCSGSEMADLFASRFKDLGGTIILKDAVEKILVNNRITEGVVLKSGRIINTPIVIAAIHPKVMISMLPDEAVKPAYRKRILQLEDTESVFSAHFEVDASLQKELPYNIFKISSDSEGILKYLNFYQLRKSRKEGINILSVITNNSYNEWERWENTTSGHRGSDYIEKKEREIHRLTDEALSIFGQFNGMKVLDSYTPLTIRDWTNSPEGTPYGVRRSSRQIIKTAMLNRTQVKGLFLAGQSVNAPGILGTALGSLVTVKSIIGSDRFNNEVLINI